MSAVRWGMPAPSHWPRTRVKYVCWFVGGGTPDKGNIEYWNGEIPWVSPKDMKSSEVIDTEDHITKTDLASSAAKLVETGAVLIVMRSGILRHSIPVAINRVPVTLNQDMRALILASTLEPRYLARLIEGHQRQFLNVWSKEGTTVESLESDLVADTEIAVPPLVQQRAIADYLDRQTARLDGLVSAKKRVLGLLAEKRQALITRAVTRGIDPRAPLHDSGIPWLGEIPAHWRTKRLRWLIRTIEQGWSPEAENREPNEDEWAVLKLNAVAHGQFNPSAAKALPVGLEARPDLEVHPGDFLITRANTPALVGDVCFVTQVRPLLMLCDLIYRLRLFDDRLDGQYLSHFFTSPKGREQIESDARGTSNSMVKISQEHIKNWWLPLPPIDEQHAIVAHITTETAKLDALRAATERTITLLKERRAALIAAAVTGRIPIHKSTGDNLPGDSHEN